MCTLKAYSSVFFNKFRKLNNSLSPQSILRDFYHSGKKPHPHSPVPSLSSPWLPLICLLLCWSADSVYFVWVTSYNMQPFGLGPYHWAWFRIYSLSGGLRVLPICAWVFSRHPSVLPCPRHVHARFRGDGCVCTGPIWWVWGWVWGSVNWRASPSCTLNGQGVSVTDTGLRSRQGTCLATEASGSFKLADGPHLPFLSSYVRFPGRNHSS